MFRYIHVRTLGYFKYSTYFYTDAAMFKYESDGLLVVFRMRSSLFPGLQGPD